MSCSALLLAAAACCGMAQEPFPMEMGPVNTVFLETPDMRPPMPDSAFSTSNGGILVHLSSCMSGNSVDLWKDRWTIELEGNDEPTVEHLDTTAEFLLRFDEAADGRNRSMTELSPSGDTLWSCVLEGTDDFDNAIQAYPLRNGGFLVVSHPDCWSTGTYLAMISPGGEMFWRNFLTSNYLLDFPEDQGEIYPRVLSLRETARGDLLLCGGVHEWITDPEAMFVVMLAGDTGEPLWKALSFIEGEARARDAVETVSGTIVAVGSTARTAHPENSPGISTWGDDEHPFTMVISGHGEIMGMDIPDDCGASLFTGITETDPETCGFLILGRHCSSHPVNLVLIRASIPDP